MEKLNWILKVIVAAALTYLLYMSFAGAAERSVLLGGVTAHIGNKYAPPGGYCALNHNIGLELETSGPGVGIGAGGAWHLDSFCKPSLTGGVKMFYRFELKNGWEISPNFSILHTDVSYFSGLIKLPVPGVDICNGTHCAAIRGLPPKENSSDGFVNIGYKQKF